MFGGEETGKTVTQQKNVCVVAKLGVAQRGWNSLRWSSYAAEKCCMCGNRAESGTDGGETA